MTKKYIQDFKSKLSKGVTLEPEELQDFFSRLEGDLKDKKYGLVWESKTEQVIEQLKTNKVYLEEEQDLKVTQDPDNPKSNILIEGDNYEALTYLNEIKQKVDVIYIDPPYNTGNKDFIYNDRFIDKEDGFRHSQWLSFMDARLRLARELLTDDGVIFISIDDNEQSQLKLLCDEVFGESNFVNSIIWNYNNSTMKNPSNRLASSHEYILVYSKTNKFKINQIRYGEVSKNLLKRFGKYADENLNIRFKDVQNEKSYLSRMIPKFKKENGRLPEDEDIIDTLEPNWLRSVIDMPTTRSNELSKFGIVFNNPKNVNLITLLLKLHSNPNATVLDFFAGSGTTGHAVLELNKEDGGNRQFILATNNENNIARDVTYERNKRVIEGYTTPKGKDVPGIPSNLAYYRTKQVSKYDIDFDEVMLQHVIPTIQLTEGVHSRTQHRPHTTQLGENIFIFNQYMVEGDEIDTLVGLVKDGDILYIQEGQVDYIKSKLPEGVVYKYLEDILPMNR